MLLFINLLWLVPLVHSFEDCSTSCPRNITNADCVHFDSRGCSKPEISYNETKSCLKAVVQCAKSDSEDTISLGYKIESGGSDFILRDDNEKNTAKNTVSFHIPCLKSGTFAFTEVSCLSSGNDSRPVSTPTSSQQHPELPKVSACGCVNGSSVTAGGNVSLIGQKIQTVNTETTAEGTTITAVHTTYTPFAIVYTIVKTTTTYTGASSTVVHTTTVPYGSAGSLNISIGTGGYNCSQHQPQSASTPLEHATTTSSPRFDSTTESGSTPSERTGDSDDDDDYEDYEDCTEEPEVTSPVQTTSIPQEFSTPSASSTPVQTKSTWVTETRRTTTTVSPTAVHNSTLAKTTHSALEKSTPTRNGASSARTRKSTTVKSSNKSSTHPEVGITSTTEISNPTTSELTTTSTQTSSPEVELKSTTREPNEIRNTTTRYELSSAKQSKNPLHEDDYTTDNKNSSTFSGITASTEIYLTKRSTITSGSNGTSSTTHVTPSDVNTTVPSNDTTRSSTSSNSTILNSTTSPTSYNTDNTVSFSTTIPSFNVTDAHHSECKKIRVAPFEHIQETGVECYGPEFRRVLKPGEKCPRIGIYCFLGRNCETSVISMDRSKPNITTTLASYHEEEFTERNVVTAYWDDESSEYILEDHRQLNDVFCCSSNCE